MSGSVANPEGLEPTKEGPEWCNHFIIGESKGCNMYLECAHCGRGQDKPWVANASRARQHLSGDGTGVKQCLKVTDSVRLLFKKDSGVSAASTSRVQSTLVGGSSPMLAFKRHEDAKAAEAKCIIYNGISFNVVDSEAWRDMITAIGLAGPTYKPNTRNTLATTELDKQVNIVKKDVKRMLASTKDYGYSIKSDGWTDVNKTYDIVPLT